MILMISLIEKGRALPLFTRKSKKGHLPETMPIELLKLIKAIIPTGTEIQVGKSLLGIKNAFG